MAIDQVISENKMELSLDLEEMFGVPIDSESSRQQLGQAVIDAIVSRTESGTKLGGGSFKKYSSDYKESLAFKVHGKTDLVNLAQAGDMLGTMDIKESTPQKITIGWDELLQNKKAFNHHTGDTLPKRPFFGLQRNELQEIIEEFKEEFQIRERLVEERGETSFRQRAVSEIARILGG